LKPSWTRTFETQKWNASKINQFLKTVLLQAAIEQEPEEEKKTEDENLPKSESLMFKIGRGFITLGKSIVSRRNVKPDSSDESDNVYLTVRDNHLQAAMDQFLPSSETAFLDNLYT